MALYFFHMRNDVDRLLDPDGRELESDQLETAALKEARAIIAADARSGMIDLRPAIEVENSDGALVHRLEFADAVTVVRDPAR